MVTAVIVDAIRTAGGKRNGRLSGWHPADLAGETLISYRGDSLPGMLLERVFAEEGVALRPDVEIDVSIIALSFVQHGIGVALGSDVGAGSGLFLPKEALQAYFIQQLLGPAGMSLTPAHLLYLATRAGARALGLEDRVGDLAVGKDFDAVWLRPADGSTLAVNLRHARDTSDALARIFTLATPADVAGVWIRGAAAAYPEPR